MAHALKMPQIGQDIEAGRIVEWAVAENQPVTKGQVILSVESDKALFEVEAPVSGVLLKILKQNGEEAEVFSPIAFIGEPGECGRESGDIILNSQEAKTISLSAKELSFVSPHSPSRLPPSPPHHPPDRVFASPAVRRRAAEQGVDLTRLSGTGPLGRIIARDLATGPRAAEEMVFSPMRKRIAQRMLLSKQTIPHFYVFRDVDCTPAAAWRDRLNQGQAVPVSWSDLIIRATALALAQYSSLNAHVKDDRLVVKSEVNIGLAVAIEDGLLVPVIPRADRLSVREISAASRDLVAAARRGVDRTSAPSSFTISNLGMCGVDRFVPIINPPECGILGVASIQKRASVVGDDLAVRDILTLCLACDHRAVDGAYAAAFLNDIKKRIEDPDQLEAQ